MRPGVELFTARDKIVEAVAKLVRQYHAGESAVEIPLSLPFSLWQWRFEHGVKSLLNCNRDELLTIIETMAQELGRCQQMNKT